MNSTSREMYWNSKSNYFKLNINIQIEIDYIMNTEATYTYVNLIFTTNIFNKQARIREVTEYKIWQKSPFITRTLTDSEVYNLISLIVIFSKILDYIK